VGACLLVLGAAAQAQNNALQFDGSNDYVQVALPTIFTDLANQDFSVSLWLRPDGVNTARVFFAQENTTEFASILLGAGTTPYLYVSRASGVIGVTTGVPLPSGQWSHLTTTWTAATGTAHIFVNGVESPVIAGGSSSTGTSGMMTIGSRTDGVQALGGALDGFRIWSTALNADQARAETSSTCGAGAPLVASYDFDVGIGGGNNAGLTTLPDTSSGGFDGTLLNFALIGGTSNWITSPVTRTTPALIFDPPLPAVLSTGEDGSGYTGTVQLAAPPSGDVVVQIGSSNTAEGVATPASIPIAASDWNVPHAVSILGVNDDVVDGPVDYSVAITVQSTDTCYAAIAQTLDAVNDDDDFTTVAPTGVIQAEGDAGTSNFVFDITLAEAVSGGVSVTFETVDGTALAGTDYTTTSGSVTFTGSAGEVQHVSVPVLGNLLAQGDRTFSLHLTGTSNPQVIANPAQADGVIVDDDFDVGVTLDDGVNAVQPAQALSYQLVVSNHSPTLDAGLVHVVFGTNPILENVAWTCVPFAGAGCAPSGSGVLDESMQMPPSAVATYTITATVPAFDGRPLVATAQASLDAGMVDSQPNDNQASDVDAGPAGIFADGFDPAQ
jgi:hypothetical protein